MSASPDTHAPNETQTAQARTTNELVAKPVIEIEKTKKSSEEENTKKLEANQKPKDSKDLEQMEKIRQQKLTDLKQRQVNQAWQEQRDVGSLDWRAEERERKD